MVCVSETENDGAEKSNKFLISGMKIIDKVSNLILHSTAHKVSFFPLQGKQG